MNRIKQMRRFALLAITVVGSLALASCGGSNNVPYGDLSDDTAYLTYEGYTVSEKELYDQFRIQGASVLSQMAEEIIFSAYMTEADTLLQSGDEDTIEYFYELINNALFNTTDEDDLQDLYDNDYDVYVRNIEQFADSLYLLDNSLDADQIITDLLGLSTPFTGYENISVLVDTYKLSIAERLYANEALQDEIKDEESDNYIEEQDVVSYYKANVEGKYDVDALVVRFINLSEANAALYQVGLKSDSKGLWYAIPDIRIAQGEPGYIDLTDTVTYGHIYDILDDLGLLGKLGTDYADRSKLSIADYEAYYKAYSISKGDGWSDPPLTTDEVKSKFVEIYNLLNPATMVEIEETTGAIVGTNGSDFSTTYTYDDLTDTNTSLRSHIYNTLTAETLIEDTDTEKAYSSRIQTFGNFRYLVYKLDDNSADEDGILVEDADDEDIEVFGDSEVATAAYDDAYAELVDTKLTNAYISSKVAEKYDDIDFDIFDNVLRILYSQSYDYSGTDKNEKGNVVANVNGTDITVQAFYDEVEKTYGINISLDLLINKVLSDSDEYTITDDEMDDFKTQFEDIITAFSGNSYSSYPASMGREAFLLVAFGAETNEEAINQLYVYPELRNQYLEDYESHFSNANSSIYEKFAQLSALQYDNQKSIQVSHLLIYFDFDADGSPDDPTEYLATLSEASVDEIYTGLENLITAVYDRLGKYTDFQAGLTAIAEEFNDTGRIERGSFGLEDGEYIDLQPELYWAEYRQLGFNLKFETISMDITNSSNIITNSSVLDEVFYDRAIELFDILADTPDDDSKFPYLDFYDQITYETGLEVSDLESVQSSFGWHMIMAESTGEKDSAMYSALDDEDNDYIDSDLNLNAYNERADTLLASQIEYYLVLNATDEGAAIPSDVSTAINTYLQPVLTKYNGTYMQRELIFKLVDGVEFADSADQSRLTTIRSINIRQFNSYLLSENGGVYDTNYDALYGSWFDILED